MAKFKIPSLAEMEEMEGNEETEQHVLHVPSLSFSQACQESVPTPPAGSAASMPGADDMAHAVMPSMSTVHPSIPELSTGPPTPSATVHPSIPELSTGPPTSSADAPVSFIEAFKDIRVPIEPRPLPTKSGIGSGRYLIVSMRQKGNPLLKYIKNVPWQYGDIASDYVMGQYTAALYLSLRYHMLNPDYVYDRIQTLGRRFRCRVLLVFVDVSDAANPLKELSKVAILSDFILIVAWTLNEAARYLETFKAYEHKPADMLKQRVEQDHMSKVSSFLTSIRRVNKADVTTLTTQFPTMKKIAGAQLEELALCPGIGETKVAALFDAFHEPFRKDGQLKKFDPPD